MPPLALGIVGLATAALGTAVSAVGSAKAGSAAQSTANYNAQLDVTNAQTTLQSGTLAEQQQRYADRQVIAKGIASAGASGVVANSGSPMDVMVENTRQAEINALTVRRNARLQAQSDLDAAKSQIIAGQNAKTASDYNVASTLLTGGTKVASGIVGLTNTGSGGIRVGPLPTTRPGGAPGALIPLPAPGGDLSSVG